MKLKRLICTALSMTMLAGVAMGADTPVTGPGPAELPKYEINERIMEPVKVWGSIKELGEKSIYLENSDETDAYSKITLRITDETVILDAVTGSVKTFADLKKNESIYAYTSTVMTRSMPPQSNAILVLCNIPADFGVPTFAQIEKVSGREDGGKDALVSGSVVLHIAKDTELLAHGTKNVPTLADLKPGTMVLSWYRMVSLSLPAQATPTKVMVFPYPYNGYVSAAPASLSVDGKALTLATNEGCFARENKLMVPLRKFAEALDCTVTWDAKQPDSVVVSKDGATLYAVTVGKDTVGQAGELVTTLALPAAAQNQVTFLCIDDLLKLHNVKLEAQNLRGY